MSDVEKFDPCAVVGHELGLFDPDTEKWFPFRVTTKITVYAPGQFAYLQKTVMPWWVRGLEEAGLLVRGWRLKKPPRYLIDLPAYDPYKYFKDCSEGTDAVFFVDVAVRGALCTFDMSQQLACDFESIVRKSLALKVLEEYPFPFDTANVPFEAGSKVYVAGQIPKGMVAELQVWRWEDLAESMGATPLSFKILGAVPTATRVQFKGSITWSDPFLEADVLRLMEKMRKWLDSHSVSGVSVWQVYDSDTR